MPYPPLPAWPTLYASYWKLKFRLSTRKIHHLTFVPDLQTADKLVESLSKFGNIASDSRPILRLDSRDLLEIVLESEPHSYLIPAHIWTPWFAALGSKSGFDSIDTCYGDLAQYVFAVETGLSSTPYQTPMRIRRRGLRGKPQAMPRISTTLPCSRRQKPARALPVQLSSTPRGANIIWMVTAIAVFASRRKRLELIMGFVRFAVRRLP